MLRDQPIILHVKSFLASPKNYLSSWRTYFALGTQAERWADFNNFDDDWDERTALMGEMVSPNSSVLEFGCGKERLETFLPEGCSYHPSDLVARSERTLICDLNIGFPDLTAHYDVMVFSGVIEYIHDLDELFKQVRLHSRECIVSYAPTNYLDCMTTRVVNGWVNHVSEATLIDIFNRAGFSVTERKLWQQQVIYRLNEGTVNLIDPLPEFISNITKTVSASGIQFLITLLTTPIMTRLYEPSAYATFGIVHTAATVVVGVGLFSLPNAYSIEKDCAARTEMVQAMLLLLCGLVLLSAIGGAGVALAAQLHLGIAISGFALVVLPVLVFTFGLRQIMVNIAIEEANFTRLSVGQILEPACSRGGSVVLGASLGSHPAFILASVAIGHISTIIILLRTMPRNMFTQWRTFIDRARLMRTLRRYADFVWFGTASQQALPLTTLGLQLAIVAFFSNHMAGQYILAVSILTLPVSLIALATAPVVYRHFIEIERTRPLALAPYLKRAMVLYLVVGLFILSPVFLFGETIFSFVFGKVWGPAGQIAATLSFAYVGTFALVGVQSIFRVTHRLKTQFLLEAFTCTLALSGAIFCFKTMDFHAAMLYLSAIWVVRSAVLLYTCLVAVSRHTHSIIESSA